VPHDALEQLLRHADASASAPPLLTELPTRVRRQHARRRTINVVAAGVATVIAIVTLPLLLLATLGRSPQPPVIAVARAHVPSRGDLVRLNLQAELHEQTAAQLLQPRSPAIPPAVDDHDVLAHVREQRDRAALILIYEADQAARQKQTNRAVAAYRRTIELFPKTYAAAVARQRLKEMPT
jgi:hypothetical protein